MNEHYSLAFRKQGEVSLFLLGIVICILSVPSRVHQRTLVESRWPNNNDRE